MSALDSWTMSCGPAESCNTATPRGEMTAPQPRSFSEDRSGTLLTAHRRSFAPEWQRAAEVAEAEVARDQHRVEEDYNQRARSLPVLFVGNHVAVQDHRTGRWDRYGVIAEVGPHRRYFVRLAGGRVLVQNRRHLRRRYGHATPDTAHEPADRRGAAADDVASAKTDELTAQPNRASCGSDSRASPLLRRSERVRRPPRRLIEEI